MALKDFINQFTQDVKEVAKSVTDKASDTIEITKLSAKISSEEATIAGLLKELGSAVLAKVEAGEIKDEVAEDLVNKINNSKNLISVLEGKIQEIKDNAAAKAEEAKEAVEEKAEDVKEAVEDKVEDVKEAVADAVEPVVEEKATKVCPLCGVEVEADAKVCPVCGYEFE